MAFVPDLEVQQVIDYLTQAASELDRNKAVKRGLVDAAKIFVSRGRLNLQTRLMGHGGVGNLMRAFRTQFRQKTTTAYAGFYEKAWTPTGATKFAPHAHLVDLGTGERWTKGNPKKWRGVMPPNLFWHDARITEEQRASDAIIKGVQQCIDQMQAKFENE